jgi:hypothetical protein
VQPHRKNRTRSRNIFTWIRQRISPYCFGVKTRAGNPAHCNRNADVLDHFAALRSGYRGRHLCRLNNADMADHFAGGKTFYFTADGRCRGASEVLVNVDIDCHGSGSLAGAIAFAEHLKATRFPGLYHESSTNGNGVHGYVVVVKGDLGDEGLNSVLGQLDRWLKAELARGAWDVEAVEVKGHAPVFGWGCEKYELLTYRSGQLAKLPREALERADELRATTRVTADELQRLRVADVVTDRASFPLAPAPGSGTADVEDLASRTVTATTDRGPRTASPPSGKTEPEPSRRERAGSISGRHFGPEELASLQGGYLDLARQLLGEKKLVATSRKVVTAEDVAIFLMLLRFFTTHMNPDGSLPTARWRETWSALHGAGEVGRPWCHHRYAAVRNRLSRQGLLAWEDEGYVIGNVGSGGLYLPGKAAKWRAGGQLMGWMVDVGEGSGVGGDRIRIRGRRERRRTSFMAATIRTVMKTRSSRTIGRPSGQRRRRETGRRRSIWVA